MNASPADAPALALRGIERNFTQAGRRLAILRGAELVIARGEIVALVGPSGSGKTTLLQIAGLLDRPDAGEVILAGESCQGLSDDLLSRRRRAGIGFVFQFHHLLPEFSALENVMLPQMIAGTGRGKARERARALLGAMQLSERESHRPARLSGGEQQRVAIARALANAPSVLLADEPTGNLDEETAEHVTTELVRVVHGSEVGALIVTHNTELAARMDRIVRLDHGALVAG